MPAQREIANAERNVVAFFIFLSILRARGPGSSTTLAVVRITAAIEGERKAREPVTHAPKPEKIGLPAPLPSSIRTPHLLEASSGTKHTARQSQWNSARHRARLNPLSP